MIPTSQMQIISGCYQMNLGPGLNNLKNKSFFKDF